MLLTLWDLAKLHLLVVVSREDSLEQVLVPDHLNHQLSTDLLLQVLLPYFASVLQDLLQGRKPVGLLRV